MDPPFSTRSPLRELARLFLRLSVVAYGGPAAHIAMMHDEVVTRRRWLTNDEYVDLLGITNLIPGPNSTEMAMHIGRTRAGWRGLVVAGTCFIVPPAVIVGVLAWLYVRYGTKPAAQDLLFGIKPVTIAIVAHALVKLVPATIKAWTTRVAAVAAVGAYLAGISELVILIGSALAVWAARRAPALRSLALAPLVPGLVADISQTRLFLVFLKVGGLLYGSGYVLLAFLRNDFVERYSVLTEQQLLDAVSIGQLTPGPLFTTATFVGYVVHGFWGAVLATIAIFLPAYLLVALIAPLGARLRARPGTAALLDGVNAGALGLMAAVTLVLGRDSLDHWLAVAIAAAAGAMLWRTRVNSAWLIIAGAIIGVAAGGAGVA